MNSIELSEQINNMSEESFSAFFVLGTHRTKYYFEYFRVLLPKYGIVGGKRLSAFMATLSVESSNLRYTTELGRREYFSRYEPNTAVGRKLGNTQIGDGYRYRGRGFIQITGRRNYEQISKGLGVDFVSNPEYLSEMPFALEGSCWWWNKNNLNDIADKGNPQAIRKRVNGGLNGYDVFLRKYNQGLQLWGETLRGDK